MSRKARIGLIAMVILIIVLIVWMSSGTKKSQNGLSGSSSAEIYTNWDEEYVLASKNPKGLYHWNAMLRLHLQPSKSITTIDYLYSIDTIPRESQPTFIFIGDYFALYEEEVDSLLSRVEDGAKLFIAHQTMDGLMHHPLFEEITQGFYYDTSIVVATQQKTYTFTSRHQAIPVATKWFGYKDIKTMDSLQIKSISGYGDLMNSCEITYGKGKVYLNTTPELFVNYQLLTANGYAYSKLWMNEIPKDQSVYWLEMARYQPPKFDFWEEMNKDQAERDDSYLQFIFQDKNRIIAILLLISGVILFLLFRAKRMQPFVPFIPKKRNMTMIFADTITSIYFNQRNPYAMIRIQQSNFYGIIQKHFHIDLSKEVSEREIESLAQKSNVKQQVILDILRKFKVLKEQNTSEYELAELRKMILNFYRQSGLISTRVQEKLETKLYVVYRNEWISGLFLLTGIGLITYGMYFLTQAIAIGVLLWPIGMIPIIIGMMRLMKPYISWSNREMHVKSLFGKKKVYNLEELTSVYQGDKDVQMHFGTTNFKLHYWELNRVDGKQFKRFVDAHNKLK